MIYPFVYCTAATLVAAAPGHEMWSYLVVGHQMEKPRMETLEGPSAPLLVAAREGRRACLSNPANPAAYRHFGNAYTFLRYDTAERRWNLSLPILGRLREVQAAAGFYDALLLQPDQEETHGGLIDLYQRLTFKDLMVRHLGELIRCAQKNGPLPKEDEKKFRERLQKLTEQHTAYEIQLRAVQNYFAVASTGKPEMQQAYLAIQAGLIETALDLLQHSTSPEIRKRGTVLRLNLLLRMGRHQEVRRELEELDERELQAMYQELGAETMDVLRFLLAGAEGDYDEADRILEGINRNIQADPAPKNRLRLALNPGVRWGMAVQPGHPEEIPNLPEDIRSLQTQALAQIIVQGFIQKGPPFWLFWQYLDYLVLSQNLGLSFGTLEQQVNFQTVRGILALEAGDPARAGQYFNSALSAAGSRESNWHFGGLSAARGYAKLLGQAQGKEP
jgi:tetratricopeptide (TPR) repeat protein